MTSQGRRHRFTFVPVVLAALAATPGLAAAQGSSRPLVAARLAQTFQRVDIDRDGLLDVVVADFLANEVRVIAKGGDGKLGAPTRLASGSGPRAVVAADFNQDGWPDVAVSNLLSGTVAIYFGEGGAKFSAPRHVNVGAGLNAMVGADFTGDGQTDLAVANFLSGEVVLLRGQGDGLFEQGEVIGQAPATSVLLVESGSDGSPQLLAVDLKSERASRFVVTAQGSLAAVGEESLAAISIGAIGNGGPAGAMTPEGLELRRVSGDGQTARIGDGVLEPFVVEMRSADGAALPGERVSFVDLAHDLGQPTGTLLVTDDQGRTGVALGAATLPGNVVVAAFGDSAQVSVFGATLTMSPVELLRFARLALAGSTIGPDAQEHHQSLLADVERELNKGDVPGAVARLTQSLAILTEAAAKLSAPESGFIDVVRRLTNQLLIVGLDGVAPATALTCGVPVAGSIAVAGEVDTFTFNVVAGERVEIATVWTSGALTPLWRLLDDTGNPVAGACGAFGGARDCGPLPTSGNPYTIEVVDNTQTDTGTYNINLERLTAGATCANATLTCGAPQVGNIEATADSDVFAFTVTAGERVEISVVWTSGGIVPLWRLLDAAGAPVAGGCGVFGGVRDCGPLPTSGNPYAVQVLDNTRFETGTYNINLERLTAGATCANATLTCGAPQVGNIEATADSDVFAFTVTAGERVEISLVWTSGGIVPLWRLLDAAGAPVAGGCGVFGGVRDCGPLPTSGNPYAVQVLDNTRFDTGTYNINLERLTAGATCANATLTCGAPQAGNIEAVADSDVFSFSATNGERVEISVMWTSPGAVPLWRLLDATGAPVAGGCGVYGGARDCGPLSTSGSPYAVQVLDNTRFDTGTYNINLERLTAGASCPNATLTCNTPQPGTIDSTGDTDLFSFSPHGDGTIRVSVVQTSGMVVPLWRLLDATGAPTTGCGAFSGTRTCSVATAGSPFGIEVVDNTRTDTGAYTVLVDQCNPPPPGGPDLAVTALSNPPATSVPKAKITVTDTTKNQGIAGAIATTNRYYLSLDQIKSTNDVRLGGVRKVPALAAGASHSGSKAVTVPNSAKLGVYYLLACADDTDVVNEGANESNNCLASATTIEIKAPDLVVSAVSNPPAAASPGSSFVATDTVHNGGNAAASQTSTNGYFLSLDTKKSGADIALTGSRTVGALNIGDNSTGNATLTVPPSTPPNSYYLIACADDTKKVAEGNVSNTGEKNNCRASATKVTITP